MLEKAEKSKQRRIILVMEEAHRLTEFHYNWLMDIYNELDREKVSMSVISVGQEELLARRTFFLEDKKWNPIYGRYKLALTCYDSPEISAYPENSGCSYTDYFFPDAFHLGERLAKEAKNLYQIFTDVRKEYGLSTDFEIPMEYFAFTVENALKKNGVHGDQCDWINKNQWREAIRSSGYVESEIYMAVAQGG